MLRDYQRAAIDGARAQLRAGKRAVLLVMPTGTGKTVVFSEAIRLAAEKRGRALVLAHRTELLDQARRKLLAVAPSLRVELEQAGARASTRADVVVASVQSLKGPRLTRFAPDAFALIIVDEAHHATAKSYRTILEHFSGRVLGVTATPDRADETKLGEVFDAVGFTYEMKAAIADGYLVPLKLRSVVVEALNLAHVKSRGGDFVEADLVAALEGDEVLLEIAGPLPGLAGDRPTIVFIAGVKNAYRLAEMLNTRTGRPGCAVALDGTSDPELRGRTLKRFERGEFQYLINVGLFTEGFDAPLVACVAIARPTQSRALFCQMIGRGTRPLTGTIDAYTSPEQRVAAIASSSKADLLVVDFTTSTAQHRLVNPIDVLGVTDPEVRKLAAELLEQDPELDVSEAIDRAAQDARVMLTARLAHEYQLLVEEHDPFRLEIDIEGARVVDMRAQNGDVDPALAGLYRDQLVDLGVAKLRAAKLTVGQAYALVRALERRKRSGLCSLKAARQLQRFGLNPNVSGRDAGYAMQALQRVGWSHCPAVLRNDPRFRVARAEGSAA